MLKIRSLVIAVAAALALGGAAAIAGSKSGELHKMTVPLPGGGSAHIEYFGDVPPRVSVERGPFAFEPFWDVPSARFDDPFGTFEFVPGDLERRVRELLREAREFSMDSDRLTQVGKGNSMPGSFSYSFSSTTRGDKTCTRSVRITTPAEGGKPNVVRETKGDCSGMDRPVPGDANAETQL